MRFGLRKLVVQLRVHQKMQCCIIIYYIYMNIIIYVGKLEQISQRNEHHGWHFMKVFYIFTYGHSFSIGSFGILFRPSVLRKINYTCTKIEFLTFSNDSTHLTPADCTFFNVRFHIMNALLTLQLHFLLPLKSVKTLSIPNIKLNHSIETKNILF